MEWLTLLNSCLSSQHTRGQGRRIAAGFWGQMGLCRETMPQKEKRNRRQREIHTERIKAKITNAASTVEAEKGRFLSSRPENTCLIWGKKKKKSSELEWWLSGFKHWLSFQWARAGLPTPICISRFRDLMSSSGLHSQQALMWYTVRHEGKTPIQLK